MPVPGLVHRYPDRVLFWSPTVAHPTAATAHRSRVVSGAGDQELHTNFEEAFRYLEQHTEIRDVLFSGGDALLFFRRQARVPAEPRARDSAYRVCPHRHPRADFPAAAHHSRIVQDVAKVSPALDERAREPSARTHQRSPRGPRPPRRPRHPARQSERAACGRERRYRRR